MHEGHGNHWQCLFETAREAAQKCIPEITASGRLIGQKPSGPLWPGQFIGLAHPDGPVQGLALITGEVDNGVASNVLASGYPVALKGVRHRLVINEVIPWRGGAEAWLKCSLPGGDGPAVTFFDTLFFLNREHTRVGVEAEFSLAAFAYSAKIDRTEPIVIDDLARLRTMNEPGTPDDQLKPITISMKGAAALIPQDTYAPDEYLYQGPVRWIEKIEVFGRKLTSLVITPLRLPDSYGDFKLALYIDDHVWKSEERPVEGSDVTGVFWLQGLMVSK